MISRLIPIPFLKSQNDLALLFACMYVEQSCYDVMHVPFLQTMGILTAAAVGSLQGVCDAVEAGVPVDTTTKV